MRNFLAIIFAAFLLQSCMATKVVKTAVKTATLPARAVVDVATKSKKEKANQALREKKKREKQEKKEAKKQQQEQ